MSSLIHTCHLVAKHSAVAILCFILLGCATTQIKETDVPVAGQTLVLGAIEIIEDGKRKKCGKLLGLDNKCNIFILPAGSTQASTYGVSEEGSFTWSLSPGNYAIAGFNILEGNRSGRFWVSFSVPQDAESLYIGDVKVLMEKGMYRIDVKDNYNEAADRYKAKNVNYSALPQKRLMDPEPTLGTFDGMRYICAEGWGIECTKKYRGITPLKPETVTTGTSRVADLKPTLEWQPSSEAGITYDLVIYEAFSYSPTGIGNSYMPGRVAIYKEGLEAPSWQSDTPLKPEQRYYWSVRLRHDGIVSNWSRYSYFAFYLVGWSSGYGQWFSFTTPSK